MKFFSLLAATAAFVAVPALAQMNQGAGAAQRGPMTRAALQAQVARMFAMTDANRDGFVTKAEAETRMAAMGPKRHARPVKSNSDHFAEMDRDRNGSISRAEFDAHHASAMENRAERRESRMERRADRMERREMRGTGLRINTRQFERFDANNDGRLSLAEAQVRPLARFTAADANRDGTVTVEERRESRQKMRAQRQQRRAS